LAAVGKEFLFAVRVECRDLHPALQQVNPSAARLPVAGAGCDTVSHSFGLHQP
jgi:hypothetical protein